MRERAVVLRSQHPIFEKPFRVGFKIEDTPTPENFKKWKPSVGPTVPTFPIYVPKKGEDLEPGLVTSNAGFEEEPDAEGILGGINMKGPDYFAIARHGSFVMWGFHCTPDQLTDEGRRLYLNTLAYAQAQKGKIVETLRLRPSRRDLLDLLVIFLPFYKEAEWRGMIERHFSGEAIPDAILKDKAAAQKWYDERAPFLHPVDDGSDWKTAYQLAVDAECKTLGVANNNLAFLDSLASRVSKDPKDPLAATLLARYVPGVAPGELSQWLAKNRDRVHFTEAGGWMWRVKGAPARSTALRPTERDEKSAQVTAKAEATESTLTITLRIAAGWHVYTPKAKEGEPVSIRILPGSAFEAAGEPAFPDDEAGVLSRFGEIRVPLKRVGAGDALTVELTYTVCDAKTCLPPKKITLSR